jgi:hypothetical protein
VSKYVFLNTVLPGMTCKRSEKKRFRNINGRKRNEK